MCVMPVIRDRGIAASVSTANDHYFVLSTELRPDVGHVPIDVHCMEHPVR